MNTCRNYWDLIKSYPFYDWLENSLFDFGYDQIKSKSILNIFKKIVNDKKSLSKEDVDILHSLLSDEKFILLVKDRLDLNYFTFLWSNQEWNEFLETFNPRTKYKWVSILVKWILWYVDEILENNLS